MEYGLFEEMNAKPQCICGTDEAGRGPLAGPVVVAAVVLPKDFPIELLNDSKKMTEQERNKAEAVIKEKALAYSITALSHKKIDEINILKASLLGMKLCCEKIQKTMPVDMLYADGNKTPDVNCPVEAVVKGDSKIPEIMAASILAKNTRDRLMVLADKKWPQYGFAKHKGYPTKDHYKAIAMFGPCPIHRMSFRLTEKTTVEKKSDSDKELF